MVQKHGLGRGLSSLIPQKRKAHTPIAPRSEYDFEQHRDPRDHIVQNFEQPDATDDRDTVEEVAIGMVRANTQQPRMYFDEEKLDELSASIKTHGVLQPLIVTKIGDYYELIAGERRLRASKKAGLTTVPVVIKKDDLLSDQRKLELALIENIQRHDLNVIEEAKSYMRLAEEFDLSQEEIAVRSGKSRSVVANRIRLLSLPIDIQKGLITGLITEGHAKIILSIDNPQKQLALYHMIIDHKLTVRQAEDKAHMATQTKHTRRTRDKTPHARRLEDQLTRYFGTRVRVSESSNGGNITVSYFSEEELKNILSRLKLM